MAGQAAVETALVMPLTIFLILGVLQLFLLYHARIAAEVAAFKSTRAGSLSQGKCERMVQAAVATLLPAFNRTDGAAALANSFRLHRDNQFVPAVDSGHRGDIVWIVRERPLANDIAGPEDARFDDPDRMLDAARGRGPLRLEVRLIFWYPMRIPFANWVIARMVLAHWGLQDYRGANPLMLTVRDARWTRGSGNYSSRTAGLQSIPQTIGGEMLARTNRREYAFPVEATYSMRMMTPARRAFFQPQNCR